MSVYIKGMEMPTSCAGCRFSGEYCYAKGDENRYSKLPCPLIPVPEHGRLIDADALSEMLEKYKKEYALKAKADIIHLHKAWGLFEAELMSESLPTIIPADKEGEG